ncbi:thioesterase [Malaciobacter mytili]|uniref:YiiD C-terminal domain-containing protein n=1 Tax=Malaciobacter mytili TaxID=603050 RepID=UPI00100B48BA|nr:YiiD C-terminal domain-containing protein [Malaciobacter mytili]RXI44127.1 thioesterase [Malaciobacter mytili]
MNLKNLEEKLHKEIPLTKFMQLNIDSIKDNTLITKVPLAPNINDKGTGFAGSLSTLVTISAWSACYLQIKALGYEKSMIAIIKSDTSYRTPITKDMVCKTLMPTLEQVEILKRKLQEKNSASITITSQIIENEKVCVEFKGIYVIKI